MNRAILAIMAGLLCGLAGTKHASSLRGDAARLSRWVYLLRHLALLLQEGSMSIPAALSASADGNSPADALLLTLAARMQTNPLLSPEAAYRLCDHNRIEAPLLTRMFSRLGHGSQASRRLAVEQSAQEMQLLAEKASAKADKDARLWQTLGFIGGTCLTIMLL